MKRSEQAVRTAALILGLAFGLTVSGSAQFVNKFGIRTPMRDGVALVSNLWLPDGTGKHPTILIRTPYDKTPQFTRYKLLRYLRAGYAVMLQDVRGRGDSEGQWSFYFGEGRDGYDTIEWIAKQSWSNGRVGTDGGSYLGTVQWLAARERPPHLACMIPTASSGRIFDEIPFLGGAFRMEWALPWIQMVSGRVSQSDLTPLIKWDSLVNERPMARIDSLLGRPMPFYQEILAHTTLDSYWKRIQFGDADFAKIGVPTLTVSGWFDGDQPGALSYWDGMSRRSDPKPPHYLVLGPWTHANTYLGGDGRVGEVESGPTSIVDIHGIRVQFFDWCLKQSAPKFEQPRVRAYVVGTNRWLESDRYPLPQVTMKNLYLTSGGSANSSSGNGRLSWDAPAASSEPDRYVHDPRNPVPSKDPATDHSAILARKDVLVYTSDSLTAPIEVLGRVFVRLWASTDANDADFTAKILDLRPDGKSVLVQSQNVGVKRARYRKGYDREVPVTPGAVEEYSIELFDLGYAFMPGHRIRIEIASAGAPFINPNQGTGKPIGSDTEFVVASQTVYHDSARPSRVLLPVLPPQ